MNLEEIKVLRSNITPSTWIYGSKIVFDGMDLKERWIDGPTIRSNYTDDTPEGQTANADCEFVASSPDIVDYLLSIIEQAEHALWRLSTANIPAPMNKFKTEAEAFQAFAEDALKAIRGN